jgi:hypothetical protein
MALVSQIRLGSKNILTINTNMERHVLLYRSIKYSILEYSIKY